MRAGIAALVCAWLSSTAAAQSPADMKQANELFLEGRELLTSHQTKAACEKFEQSIAIDPTAPGVMLNLGLCYEMLEQYATSLYWFRKAQVAAAEAKLQEYEDEAKRHTLALATKVSVVRIDASAAPADTEIRIDGKLIAPTDYARVEVDRGGHDLEARATGKQPYTQGFRVTVIDAGTVTIPALADEAHETTPPNGGGAGSGAGGGSDTGPTTSSSPNLGRTILAASFGAAGLGLCIASPLWANHIKKDYDAAVAKGEMPSTSAAKNKEHIATGMFIAGVGLIGLGTYLYLTAPSGSQATPTTATVLVPVFDAHQVGVAISGSL